MNKAQFIYQLKKLVAWNEEPQLDDDDLDLIFSKSRRKDRDGYLAEPTQLWERNVSYSVGDVIVPTSFAVLNSKTNRSNEFSFIATTAGTSDSTEPTWADSEITDGTVTWERHEAAYWTPTFDLNYAAYLAWDMKASRAASKISITTEGATFNREQFIANCLTMKRQYAAKLNFSVQC